MDIKTDTRNIAGIKRREPTGVEGRGVGGMIRTRTLSLQPRHVCKIEKLARRLERGDERGKVVAIGCKQRRARRPLRHEDPRHRGEELLAYDFLHHGETIFEHFR